MILTANENQLEEIWKLNEQHVPAVSSVSKKWFREMHKNPNVSISAKVIDNEIAGYYVAMPPNENYKSLNYQWFSNNYNDFMYLDRIVVSPKFQKQGIGKQLYYHLREASTGKHPIIACEVNIKPLNQNSIDFHHHLGFKEVGQQDTDNGKKAVCLITWDI